MPDHQRQLDAAADKLAKKVAVGDFRGDSLVVPVEDCGDGYGKRLAVAVRARGLAARFLPGGTYELDGETCESEFGMLRIEKPMTPRPPAGMEDDSSPPVAEACHWVRRKGEGWHQRQLAVYDSERGWLDTLGKECRVAGWRAVPRNEP